MSVAGAERGYPQEFLPARRYASAGNGTNGSQRVCVSVCLSATRR